MLRDLKPLEPLRSSFFLRFPPRSSTGDHLGRQPRPAAAGRAEKPPWPSATGSLDLAQDRLPRRSGCSRRKTAVAFSLPTLAETLVAIGEVRTGLLDDLPVRARTSSTEPSPGDAVAVDDVELPPCLNGGATLFFTTLDADTVLPIRPRRLPSASRCAGYRAESRRRSGAPRPPDDVVSGLPNMDADLLGAAGS